MQLGVGQRHHDPALFDGSVRHPLALQAQQVEHADGREYDGRQHGCNAESDQPSLKEPHEVGDPLTLLLRPLSPEVVLHPNACR